MSNEEKPKAFIKYHFEGQTFPDGNPYNLPKQRPYKRNSTEYKNQTRMLNELSREKKASPISAKITF